MSRFDLNLLPEDAKTRVELVKLDHEEKIREVMRAWHEAPANSSGSPPKLTCKQQKQLLDLVVAMGIHLGKTAGSEYLAVTPLLEEFESDIHNLMASVADEAQDRFNQLIAEFHVVACRNGHSDLRVAVHQRVRNQLNATIDDLIIKAVAAHKERLKAKCAKLPVRPAAATSAESDPSEKGPGNPGWRIDRKGLAERVEKLRIGRGLSAERLAHEAHLDKKTLIGIRRGRREVRLGTLESLAHALGVSIADLVSG